jgi:uncharacterized protein DUF6084
VSAAVFQAGSIPELRFAVDGAARAEHAAVPTLLLSLRVEAAGGAAIRSILLDTQIQIAARRRPYGPADHDRLLELFGPPRDWGTTLRTLLWTRQTLVVPPFASATIAELPVPCTYDFDVTASRYLDALTGGEVPLELLFSGTVFYTAPDGALQVSRIPWDLEAEFRLPVATWRATMERHFPGTAWLRVSHESLERLHAFRSRAALGTWDDTLAALLEGRDAQ